MLRENYISKDAVIKISELCIHDSNVGYEADFSVNGEVDGWTYYDGIHTYGVWDGFLFGTLYGDYGIIGRHAVFTAIPCEDYYMLKIIIKYMPKDREGAHLLPTKGKVRWRTLSRPNWSAENEMEFDLIADGNWHSYILNMGQHQYWQGDVNDLRFYIPITNGMDGDEFFVREIEISSIDKFKCTQIDCSYYTQYIHPCQGIGARGCCQSIQHSVLSRFDIEEGDILLVNINGYGNETVRFNAAGSLSGLEAARKLSENISKTNVGGYAECYVDYTSEDFTYKFKIYSGTYTNDSTVSFLYSPLAQKLGFFNELEEPIYTTTSGTESASKFSPYSTFRAKTYELYSLFDGSGDTGLDFNPFIYSLEGGRRDWYSSGQGMGARPIGHEAADAGGVAVRAQHRLYNAGMTLIDFNHPFNASGRVTNLYGLISLDPFNMSSYNPGGGGSQFDIEKIMGPVAYGQWAAGRIAAELEGCKFMIFRPKRDGFLETIYEFDIPDRDRSTNSVPGQTGALYANSQEVTELTCDIFVQRGDLLGIYNASVYVGKTILGEIDAMYYQVEGKPSGEFFPGALNGQGSRGVPLYARSTEKQKRLAVDLDLKSRYNISDINIKGYSEKQFLEYNLARCLDINWQVDLFGLDHWTEHKSIFVPGTFYYPRPNTAYGLENLEDGVLTVPEGLAADNFYLTGDYGSPTINYGCGPGVVPTNPRYFWVNGDEEWLGVYLHARYYHTEVTTYDFDEDPIAFTLYFPHEKNKKIYKSKIYFKERYNFRSFQTSFYRGTEYIIGNADNNHFELIPRYETIILDELVYTNNEDDPMFGSVNLYLFENPTIGHPIKKFNGSYFSWWDPVLSDIPGVGLRYEVQYDVVNDAQNQQAQMTDWQTITHEWEPEEAKGFRIYTNYHKSTKICEMEVYAYAKDIGSNMSAGINVQYSDYGEVWWPANIEEVAEGETNVFIGYTPRFINLEFTPITEIRYDTINVNLKTEDSFAGTKGCEYVYYLDNVEKGKTTDTKRIDLKNIYETEYDLYVDIAGDNLVQRHAIFSSDMNNDSSIFNPEVGPDALYIKEPDYHIVNRNNNVAINCEVWGLRNLIDGKMSYQSIDKGQRWSEFKTLENAVSIDYNNIPSISISEITIPVISRNRYWKLAFTNPEAFMNIREMRVYYQGEEQPATFYYEKPKDLCNGGTSSASAGSTGSVNAFDNKTSTVMDFDSYTTPQWLMYTMSSEQVINKFRMFPSTTSDRNPVSFSLQASVSGTFTGGDITTLVDVVDYNWWQGVTSWREWSFTNFTPYKYYRIYVTKTSANYIQIGEIELCNETASYRILNESLTTTAPHISNGSITNSYYQINGKDAVVGFDLGEQKPIDKIILYHDTLEDYDYYFCGLDATVWLYLSGDYDNPIIDESYYEETITKSGTSYTEGRNFSVDLSFYDDFSSCNLVDWAVSDSGPDIFTCVPASGINPGYYSFYMQNATWTYGAFKKLNHVDGNDQTRTVINSSDPFVLKFKIKISQHANSGGSYDSALGVGFYSNQSTNYYGQYKPMGATFAFNKGQTGITTFVIYITNEGEEKVYSTNNAYQLNTDYYVTFSGNGLGNYSGKAWTDNWDGSNQVVNLSLNSSTIWTGDKCGLFAIRNYHNLTVSGTLYSIELDAGHTVSTTAVTNITNGKYFNVEMGDSIYFPNKLDHLIVSHDFGFDLRTKSFSFEAWVMFEELPANGEYATFFQNWGIAGNHFRIGVRNQNGTYYFFSPVGEDSQISPYLRTYEWHRFVMIRRNNSGSYENSLWIDNWRVTYGSTSNAPDSGAAKNNPQVGYNFKGWISNLVFSSDYRTAGARTPSYTSWRISYSRLTKRYAMSLYASPNNSFFGKYLDFDLFRPHRQATYYDTNILGSLYHNYLSIDMGQTHKIDLVRSYGTTGFHPITDTEYITYANTETDDPAEVVYNTFGDIQDSFNGYNNQTPNTTLWDTETDVVIYDNKLRFKIDPFIDLEKIVTSKFSLIGDFDLRIDYVLDTASFTPGVTGWSFGIGIIETSGSFNEIRLLRKYASTYLHHYSFESGTGTLYDYTSTTDAVGSMRIRRRGRDIYAYYKDGDEWKTAGQRIAWSFAVIKVKLIAKTFTNAPAFTCYIDNFTSTLYDVVNTSYKNDARWIRLYVPNGDGTSRTVRKLGIYPDISLNKSPLHVAYNHYWDNLGPSITNYSEGENVALGATVSGSSYIGDMRFENITNGIIDGSINNCWGSDNTSTQWVTIDLGEIISIYRVKIFHGYSTEDVRFYITNYQVQHSLDNVSFTTLYTISSNTSFERTHDLQDPVSTRYIRIYITGWSGKDNGITIRTDDGITLFRGATLREVQVYSYYGYQNISSEEYPIIAINLKDQFYLSGHKLIGVLTESTSSDWSNDAANFTYSDSVSTNPSKISFKPFGTTPNYEQWVLIKRDTATNRNDGPDYLKHAVVSGVEYPNPCDYYWWWTSNISTLSEAETVDSKYALRPLEISYPASDVLDIVQYRKGGANFGNDVNFSWRDGFNFYIEIDDINKLDCSDGYIAVAGIDGTSQKNPVEYRWYLSTLSGSGMLQTGGGYPFLRFKNADEVIYTPTTETSKNPLYVELMTLENIIFAIKGKGEPFKILIDGFQIGRNYFLEYCKSDVGLYMGHHDVVTVPLSEFSMARGTIEFWWRGDCDWYGFDIFRRFNNRALFHVSNGSNDVLGMLINREGLVSYFGTVNTKLYALAAQGLPSDGVIDTVHHIAITFSNNGKNLYSDGSTVRMYINNKLVATSYQTWNVSDTKYFKLVLGGQALTALKQTDASYVYTISMSGVLGNLKIYNFCKTDFTESINSVEDSTAIIRKAGELIEISSDNVTFYKVGDAQLPFKFEKVPAGAIIPVYVRSNIPDNLTGYEDRTAGIAFSWDIGV